MKPITIGAFSAKTHLSELLEKVRQGRSFFITKRGHPVAELRPLCTQAQRPQFGSDRGRISMAEDFEAPLPEMQEYTR